MTKRMAVLEAVETVLTTMGSKANAALAETTMITRTAIDLKKRRKIKSKRIADKATLTAVIKEISAVRTLVKNAPDRPV
jgi:hypothetical protein